MHYYNIRFPYRIRKVVGNISINILGHERKKLWDGNGPVKTIQGWRRKEEILPLFNKEEAQEADKEEIPKLNLKPLPMELKYTYLEENK